MGFTFHIQHHTDPATERTLGWITDALRHIIEGQRKMGLDFSKLRAEVNQIGADVQAIAERLRTADPADQAVIDDIVNQLDAHGKILEGFTLPEQPQPPADPSA